MAHRYVPKTYNNRRFLRLITGAVITLALTVVILFLILFFWFQRYVVDGQLQIPWLPDEFPVLSPLPVLEEPDGTDGSQSEALPSASPTPSPMPSSENGDEDGDGQDGDDDADPDDDDGLPNTYTLEQIEEALQPQFAASAFGARNPEVVRVREVERDRDAITIEGSGETFDLTNSLRYRVEFSFDQPQAEYDIWEENYANAETKPFRRDGDRTVLTEHYYFNDDDGEPVLAFIRD